MQLMGHADIQTTPRLWHRFRSCHCFLQRCTQSRYRSPLPQYRANFLRFLGLAYPQVNCLEQLRCEPHLLGWMSHLRSIVRPLSTASYINQLTALRSLF